MPDAMPNPITGGCLCGKIRYKVTQPLKNIIACHCTHCQKSTGSGASYNVVASSAAVSFTAGQPKLYADVAQSGNILKRYFCADCGSPIYAQREKLPEFMVLKAGTLDDSADLQLVMNIWTKSARPWMHIDPATECHPESRPAKA